MNSESPSDWPRPKAARAGACSLLPGQRLGVSFAITQIPAPSDPKACSPQVADARSINILNAFSCKDGLVPDTRGTDNTRCLRGVFFIPMHGYMSNGTTQQVTQRCSQTAASRTQQSQSPPNEQILFLQTDPPHLTHLKSVINSSRRIHRMLSPTHQPQADVAQPEREPMPVPNSPIAARRSQKRSFCDFRPTRADPSCSYATPAG